MSLAACREMVTKTRAMVFRARRQRKRRAVSTLTFDREMTCQCQTHTVRGHSSVAEGIDVEVSCAMTVTECEAAMIEEGWCPHQVRRLTKQYELEALRYFSRLPVSEHRLADHTGCMDRDACMAYNTEQATYKTRHTTDRCSCRMIKTPYEELVKVIRNKGIPLLSIEGTRLRPRLRVHSRSARSVYIAISHVWADGLGNPHSNALPLCQIQQIRNHVSEAWNGERQVLGIDLTREPLLWMDTLCIPVGRNESRWRLVQINKMASIYKGAQASLVLDAELLSIRALPTIVPRLSISLAARARLASSVWMSRSWTLQEGQLPGLIFVQFLDGAFRFGRVADWDGEYSEKFFPLPGRDGYSDHGACLPSFVPSSCVEKCFIETLFNTFCLERDTSLSTVWNELSGRSSTMAEDIPVIVSNTLDLDNRHILRYRQSDNMLAAILLSMGRLPMSLMFNEGPKKIGNLRTRWIPARIGPDVLCAEEVLTVCSSYLLYRHIPGDGPNGKFSVYMCTVELLLASGMVLQFSKEDPVRVELLRGDHEPLQIPANHKVCFIIESIVTSKKTGRRRGACFLVDEKSSSRRSGNALSLVQGWRLSMARLKDTRTMIKFYDDWPWPFRDQVAWSSLLYDCPVRLCPFSPEEAQILTDPVGKPEEIDSVHDFRVQYDPPSGFKPLTRRRNPLDSPWYLEMSVISIWLVFETIGLFVASGIEGFRLDRWGGMMLGWLISVFVISPQIVVLLFIESRWETWSLGRYLSSVAVVEDSRC